MKEPKKQTKELIKKIELYLKKIEKDGTTDNKCRNVRK